MLVRFVFTVKFDCQYNISDITINYSNIVVLPTSESNNQH